MPPLLYDIMRVLLLLSGPAAFVCLILAGIALRRDGGTVFSVGGGFSKHMLWAVIFLALEPSLTWFQFLGVVEPLNNSGSTTSPSGRASPSRCPSKTAGPT